MIFERVVATEILTVYVVCHRQKTKGFTSQRSFQQIKKVGPIWVTSSGSRSHEIRMLSLIVATMDNWLSSMNSPHQTIYVLTWRRMLLRRIAANIRIVARIPRQGADCIEGQLSSYRDWNSGGIPLPSEGCTQFGWSYQTTSLFPLKRYVHVTWMSYRNHRHHWPRANTIASAVTRYYTPWRT